MPFISVTRTDSSVITINTAAITYLETLTSPERTRVWFHSQNPASMENGTWIECLETPYDLTRAATTQSIHRSVSHDDD